MLPDPTESISEFVLPSFKKILVTHDGRDKSNKAINYAIYLSNLSGAEIMILHIIEDNSELEGTSVDISSKPEQSSFSLSNPSSNLHSISPEASNETLKNIEGNLIDSMEEKIKKIEQAECKNKVSYKFKTGSAVHEIVNEINEMNYDLVRLC